MTDTDVALRRALERTTPRFDGERGDWDDVLRRAARPAPPDLPARAARTDPRPPRPTACQEASGWGTRPIRRFAGEPRRQPMAEIEFFGWGTRPI